jgi:26S proteasome regulatory subunit T5
VANIVELLDIDVDEKDEESAFKDVSLEKTGKCAVVKTSTRQTYFLPEIGLVPHEELTPGLIDKLGSVLILKKR